MRAGKVRIATGIVTGITQLLLMLAGINALYVAFAYQYDWRLGPLHLVAHGIFKPLLILSGSFILALLLQRAGAAKEPAMPPRFQRFLMVAGTVCATYALSFWINYHHAEWAHTDVSAAHATVRSLTGYFTRREYDGFYRPLGFLSLWVDWRIFAGALSWYHLQSLLLQVVNSLLVAKLCRRLGGGDAAATATALIFAVSPASFEAVMWPGARFDEIATLFSLLALILAIGYTVSGGLRNLTGAAGCLALGLVSKECAYAVPPLLVVLWLRRRAERMEPEERCRWFHTFASMAGVVLAAAACRYLVVGGVGGYGASLHFAVNSKTFTSLLSRALLASQFAVDGTVALRWWIQAALAAFGALLVYIAHTCRPQRRDWWYLVCLLVALLPAANVLAFLGPALVQGRYLYFASVWPALFLGAILMRTPRPKVALAVWVAAAGLAVFFNISVHQRRLDAIPGMMAQIASQLRANPQCRQVALVNLPDQTNGSLFATEELIGRLRMALPEVKFEWSGASVRQNPAPAACVVYTPFKEE